MSESQRSRSEHLLPRMGFLQISNVLGESADIAQ